MGIGRTTFRNKAARAGFFLCVVVCFVPSTLSNSLRADDNFASKANREESATQRSPRFPDRADSRRKKDKAAEEALDRRVRVLKKGNSSRASRRAGQAALPLDKLSDVDRERAEETLASARLFRELPTIECEVEPGVYQFFIRHPDVAVSIWRAMKISTFRMTETGPKSYDVDSGDGTTGVVDVLYEGDNETLIICKGLFKNPLWHKPIQATGLFHLKTELSRRKDGTPVTTYRGRMFVAFPSQTVAAVAKLISPVSNIIVDRNFREVSLFLHMMSLAMRRQPGWVEQISERLEGVPDSRREELLKVTAKIFVAAQRRRVAAGGEEAKLSLPVSESRR